MNAAAGDARNTAAPATSSGVPHRARGVDSITACRRSEFEIRGERGVDPAGSEYIDAHSRRHRSRERLAEREHASLDRGEELRIGSCHSGQHVVPTHIDDHATVRLERPGSQRPARTRASCPADPPRAAGRASRRRTTRRQAPVRMSAPALLIHASRRPSPPRTAGPSLARSASFEISTWNVSTRRPSARICDSVSRTPPAFDLKVTATSAPARAAAMAIARPMPLDAPVTSTTRPLSGAALESGISRRS